MYYVYMYSYARVVYNIFKTAPIVSHSIIFSGGWVAQHNCLDPGLTHVVSALARATHATTQGPGRAWVGDRLPMRMHIIWALPTINASHGHTHATTVRPPPAELEPAIVGLEVRRFVH